MTSHVNYFVPQKNSRLIRGHIAAKDLYNKILEHDGSTAYACYFDLIANRLKFEFDTLQLDKDGKKIHKYFLPGEKIKDPNWINNGKSFVDYEGPARPAFDLVSFDFDDENDPGKSLADVRSFVEWLDLDNLIIFFSGSKGFHVLVPFQYFPLEENEHLPNQLKSFAKFIKEKFKTLDTSIYNYNRKFRVPFTQHEKTGLFKTLITYNEVFELSIEQIIEKAKIRKVSDFKTIINYSLIEKKNEKICEVWEQAKRASYEVEKDKGGSAIKPTAFEKFDNKLCIKKMLENRCEDVGRNNACMRIVNDYFRTGKTQSKCEKDLQVWIKENGLPESELNQIISDIYNRGANYNFGCQDECKTAFCSSKCSIWKKLDPSKRPMTVDMPLSALGDLDPVESDDPDAIPRLKNEFWAVKWIMEKIFHAQWDDKSQSFFDSDCLKQSAEEIFYYTENHWQLLDELKIQFLKTKLNSHYGNKLAPKQIESVWKMLLLYIPSKPDEVDLFSPRDDVANFLDGTVHLVRDGERFDLVFKNHSKYDYCTNIFDLKFQDYLDNPDRKNNKFESWLHTVLDHDQASFNLVQELYGASLMPKFPKLFFLLGQSSTGKSTTIKILKRMHRNERNMSGVSPDAFTGFNLMTMVGKLINVVMDIKTDAELADDVVKQIDDASPIRIPQKNKVDVYAKIPNLHIFGANKLPKTKEGYSGAMKRRAEILNFDKVFVGEINRNIANDIFEVDPIGVFCFAIRGLKRLVQENNGLYSTSEKSKRAVEKWEASGNPLLTFIDDLSSEGLAYAGQVVKYEVDDAQKIKRGDFWEHFRKWQMENLERFEQYGRMRFNAEVESQFRCKRLKDTRYVLGVGVQESKNVNI